MNLDERSIFDHFKNITQTQIDYLRRNGYDTGLIDKKNVRILYEVRRLNGKGVITDYRVEDFSPDQIEKKQYLYKKFSFDFGNCLSNWDEWTLTDVLLKTFVSYHVEPSMKEHIIFQLFTVKEWQEPLFPWIYRNFNNLP